MRWEEKKLETVDVDGVTYAVRGQASGMDDGEREFMTENLADLIGTVIEVGHNGVYPNSTKMRHPQFLRFRPDKGAEDVGWEDD
jgi:hypothetical protein